MSLNTVKNEKKISRVTSCTSDLLYKKWLPNFRAKPIINVYYLASFPGSGIQEQVGWVA